MHDYLREWAEWLIKANPQPLHQKHTVTGLRYQHLGPRWEYAKIQVTIEPSEQFEVVDRVESNADLQALRYPDWAVFGILDVLMVCYSYPLSGIRITLEHAEYSLIDSSPMAFRNAGRNAAREFLKCLHESS